MKHFTLPAKYYVDPAYFSEERERFFGKHWVCVGRSEDVEGVGAYVIRDVAGERVILTRSEDGEVRAFYNVCRHRGTRLCEKEAGKFNGRIQCPYHAWTYSLKGELVGAPGMNDVEGFNKAEYPLHSIACEVWEGHVFVNLSLAASPLSEQLGSLVQKFAPWKMGELKRLKRAVYDIHANWKLIIQNYSECLHCPVIHPALEKVSHFMSGDNEPPTRHYLGGRMDLNPGVFTMSGDGKQKRPYLPGVSEADRRHVYYYALLPNLLLSLHPDYMMTHVLIPKACDRTEIVCEFHFHPEAIARSDFDPSDATDFWDMTNQQDWRISEESQRGISSRGYTPGPYSPREGLLFGLDKIVRGEI